MIQLNKIIAGKLPNLKIDLINRIENVDYRANLDYFMLDIHFVNSNSVINSENRLHFIYRWVADDGINILNRDSIWRKIDWDIDGTS